MGRLSAALPFVFSPLLSVELDRTGLNLAPQLSSLPNRLERNYLLIYFAVSGNGHPVRRCVIIAIRAYLTAVLLQDRKGKVVEFLSNVKSRDKYEFT